MVRSDTGRIVTVMADEQAVRDRPVLQRPREPMYPVRHGQVLEFAVAGVIARAGPFPATVTARHSRPQRINQRCGRPRTIGAGNSTVAPAPLLDIRWLDHEVHLTVQACSWNSLDLIQVLACMRTEAWSIATSPHEITLTLGADGRDRVTVIWHRLSPSGGVLRPQRCTNNVGALSRQLYHLEASRRTRWELLRRRLEQLSREPVAPI
jgi:hypothetical protein